MKLHLAPPGIVKCPLVDRIGDRIGRAEDLIARVGERPHRA
ncbi:MAG: hypothetical protein WAL04_18230 [Acidimicrobiales bacterium]|jgi:hypothetical protein